MKVEGLLSCNFPIGPVLLWIFLLEMLCHEGLIGCASKALYGVDHWEFLKIPSLMPP